MLITTKIAQNDLKLLKMTKKAQNDSKLLNTSLNH